VTPPVILLLGASGQVGHELTRELSTLGTLHRPTSAQASLTDAVRLRDTVRTLQPSVIVNAAAYTAVDRAEAEEGDLSRVVNGVAPGILAEESERSGAMLVHFSTDYVFDGEKSEPYREDDPASPINAYGRHKLEGERAVAATGADALIFRLGWVYDLSRRNFLTTVRRLAAERETLSIVADQVGVPTWSGCVATAVAQIVAMRCRAGAAARLFDRGVYHMSGSGRASWAEFAERVLRDLPVPGREHVRVTRIASAQFTTPARRPAYSVLSSGKLRDTFGVALPSWEEQLALAITHSRA
jgi:dTDP-4-dehydrorhamnose reductase